MSLPEEVANAITVTLVACAFVVTGFVVHRWTSSPSPSPEYRTVANAPELAKAGFKAGPASGAVTITVFTDYQCPYCKQFSKTLQQLRDRYPERVTVSYRHVPLPGHEWAKEAAVASVCASEQGQFLDYHRLLFDNAESLNDATLDRLAAESGVDDVAQFRACRSGTEAQSVVERDLKTAQSIGIKAVPSVLIGNRLYSGGLPFDVLDEHVQNKLAS